jgi:hypothetical protein
MDPEIDFGAAFAKYDTLVKLASHRVYGKSGIVMLTYALK